MIYLIAGEEVFFIEKTYQEILAKHHLTSDLITYFPSSKAKVNFEDLSASARGGNLFSPLTALVFENPSFLNNKLEDSDYQAFLKFVRVLESDDVVAIFLKKDGLFNGTYKQVKYLKTKAVEHKFLKLKPFEYQNYLKKRLSELKIKCDANTLSYLFNYLKTDIGHYESELSKLSLLNAPLTINLINDFLTFKSEDNLFKLYDAIVKQNTALTISTYRKLIANNIQPLAIIGLLVSQLRFLGQVSLLITANHSVSEITNILNANEYRVKKAYEVAQSIDHLKLLNALAKIEAKIKTENISDVDDYIELMLIKEVCYEFN